MDGRIGSVDHHRPRLHGPAVREVIESPYAPAHAIPPLEHEDIEAGGMQGVGAGETRHPRADDDDIVFFWHRQPRRAHTDITFPPEP
jgi:hypothetical protein